MELQHTHTFRVTMTRSHRGDSARTQNAIKTSACDAKAAASAELNQERDASKPYSSCSGKRPDCEMSSAAKLMQNSHWLRKLTLKGQSWLEKKTGFYLKLQNRTNTRVEKTSPTHRSPWECECDYLKWLIFCSECQRGHKVICENTSEFGGIYRYICQREFLFNASIARGRHQQEDVGVKLWTLDVLL